MHKSWYFHCQWTRPHWLITTTSVTSMEGELRVFCNKVVLNDSAWECVCQWAYLSYNNVSGMGEQAVWIVVLMHMHVGIRLAGWVPDCDGSVHGLVFCADDFGGHMGIATSYNESSPTALIPTALATNITAIAHPFKRRADACCSTHHY
jgi:hypothetical protein